MKIIVATEEKQKKMSFQLRYNTLCCKLGWLRVEDYISEEERDEYDVSQSMIFLAMDDLGKIIGTSRLILQGEIPLPIEKNFELLPHELIETMHGKMEFCVEVSRFVVPENPVYKEHEITMQLCLKMIKTSMEMGVTHMLMSVDYRFFRLLRMLGIRLIEIGEPKFYMGSKTIPGVFPLGGFSPAYINESLVSGDSRAMKGRPAGEMVI